MGSVQPGMCILMAKIESAVSGSFSNFPVSTPASIAATIYSFIGNVAGGSVFSVIQSAGAGGAGGVIVNGVVQIGGAVLVLGNAAIAWLKCHV